MEATYKVSGMMCKHCAARVKKAIETVAGVETVEIDLDRAIAIVGGEAKPDEVMAAVTAVGYGIDII